MMYWLATISLLTFNAHHSYEKIVIQNTKFEAVIRGGWAMMEVFLEATFLFSKLSSEISKTKEKVTYLAEQIH